MMSLLGKRLLVLGACLALVLATVQGLGARLLPSHHSERISYLFELERAIFHYTNEVRQKHGLSSLTWENALRDVARAHSADMLVRNYFSHESPDGKSLKDRLLAGRRLPMSMAGENIWMCTGRQVGDVKQLARSVIDNWMSSPGHRSNLLRPEFTDIGVGAATNGNDIKVTQVFIRHRQK